jgi:hypothetical protein
MLELRINDLCLFHHIRESLHNSINAMSVCFDQTQRSQGGRPILFDERITLSRTMKKVSALSIGSVQPHWQDPE